MRAREQPRILVPERLVGTDDNLYICRLHKPGVRGQRHVSIHVLPFSPAQTSFITVGA